MLCRNVKVGADVIFALAKGECIEPAMPIDGPVCISGSTRRSCPMAFPCPKVCSDLEWPCPNLFVRCGSTRRGESEDEGVRFECDLAWRIVFAGFGEPAKVDLEGEGVEWPVKASGVGKTIVGGLFPALLESNWKVPAPSFLFLTLPPQFKRME